MTDKERLEEINQRITDMKRKSGMPTEVLTREGWKSVLPIFTEDFEYLQEQAERVQELETRIDKFYKLNMKLHKQNKRYHEALEYIAAGIPVHSPVDYENKARKALEVDNHE